MDKFVNLKALLDSVLFSLIGIIVLTISFVVIEKITPQNLYKEVVEKGNIAVSIMAAAFIIAIAIIISAAIHG